MTDLFIVGFIIIGLASWVSHILTCPPCVTSYKLVALTLAEAVGRVFGWPLFLVEHLKRSGTEARPPEGEQRTFEEIGMVSIKANPGETKEAFIERALREAMANVELKRSERLRNTPGDTIT